MEQEGDTTAKRISDVRHIAAFLLAPPIGCGFVAASAIVAAQLTTGAHFFVVVGYWAFFACAWTYPGLLLVALPLHGRFLRRRSYRFGKYVLIAAVVGTPLAVLPMLVSYVVLRTPFELLGLAAFPVAACFGIVIASAFWLIAMWRNPVYPATAGSADVSARRTPASPPAGPSP